MVGEFHAELRPCRLRTTFHDYRSLNIEDPLEMGQTNLLVTIRHGEERAQELHNAFGYSHIDGLLANKSKYLRPIRRRVTRYLRLCLSVYLSRPHVCSSRTLPPAPSISTPPIARKCHSRSSRKTHLTLMHKMCYSVNKRLWKTFRIG